MFSFLFLKRQTNRSRSVKRNTYKQMCTCTLYRLEIHNDKTELLHCQNRKQKKNGKQARTTAAINKQATNERDERIETYQYNNA